MVLMPSRGEKVRRRERTQSRRSRTVGLEGGFVVARSALKESSMLGATVDDFVVTEWSMTFGAVLIGSFTLKVRYHESEEMACLTFRAWGWARHSYLMFTRCSAPDTSSLGRELSLRSSVV